MLSELNFQEMVLGNIEKINLTADSGYAYVIFTQTILGLAAIWAMVSFSVPQYSPSNKRFAHGVSLYIFVNFLVGAAVLSTKVVAPIWIIAGCLYAQYRSKQAERT